EVRGLRPKRRGAGHSRQGRILPHPMKQATGEAAGTPARTGGGPPIERRPMLIDTGEKDILPELRKRFRFGEFVAEKLIAAIAYMSLAAILLIYIFIFREAWPIFAQEPRGNGKDMS